MLQTADPSTKQMILFPSLEPSHPDPEISAQTLALNLAGDIFANSSGPLVLLAKSILGTATGASEHFVVR